MKKTMFLFCLLFSLVCTAQSFEGTITWAMTYDVLDPLKKAEMEKGQQSLKDPANQAQLKKMQEQLNTPEMKSMMDANPQMKTQMENAMKALQGGSGPGNSMVPTGYTVQIKNNSSLVKTEGGIMPTEILYVADKKQAFRIDRSAKTYTLLNSATGTGRNLDSIHHTVTKTTETRNILGYICTKYLVDVTDHGTTMHQVFWTTNDIKGFDIKSMQAQRMGRGGQSLYYEGLTGVPLRMELIAPQMNMVMQVTAIKKESLPAADFSIPADYEETKGLMR